MLGNNHYGVFKGINKVKSYDELEKAVNGLEKLKKPSESERVKFFYHYKRSFFEGNIEVFYKKASLNKKDYDDELSPLLFRFVMQCIERKHKQCRFDLL